jgi:hypothetical protein
MTPAIRKTLDKIKEENRRKVEEEFAKFAAGNCEKKVTGIGKKMF